MERMVASLTFNVLASLAVIVLGLRLLERRIEGEGRRAATMFSVWWLALGAETILNVAVVLAGRTGREAWVAPFVYAQVVLIGTMCWGLLYYLAYLFTGRAGLLAPMGVAYGAITAGGLALIVSLRPTGLTPNAWGGAVRYANEPATVVAVLFWLCFLLPPLVCAVLYGSLFFRVREPTQRYRVALVSMGIFVWFTSALVFTGGVGAGDVRAVGSMGIAALAILAIWLAYAPPAFVKRRLGIHSLSDEVALAPVPRGEVEGVAARRIWAAARALRAADLARRANELV